MNNDSNEPNEGASPAATGSEDQPADRQQQSNPEAGGDHQTKPAASGADQSASDGETLKTSEKPKSDFGLTVDHHKSFLVKFWSAIERVFHYFYVGCIGLLGLAVLLSIPILILGFTAVVLGIPGFVLYQLQGKPIQNFCRYFFTSPYSIVLTIFWAGYFFTHGWPRLRDSLQSMLQKMRPLLGWVRTMLSSFSEKANGDGS